MLGSILGWTMAIAFAICGVPQAYECYKNGHGKGLSYSFMVLWIIGESAGILYVFTLRYFEWPLFVNYCCSLLVTLTIFKYMIYPRPKWKKPKLLETLKKIWKKL